MRGYPTPRRARSRAIQPLILAAQGPVRMLMSLFATRQWSGGDNIPHDGAAIICGNHVAPMDALLYGEMLYLHRVPPRFLAKSDLFDIPIVGMLLRATGQIPVFRGTRRSTEAISAAREALEDGAVLTLFPEGTYTRDPHAWPMKGRRGAARDRKSVV